MVSKEFVEKQLINLGFNIHSWPNRAEVRELPHVLLPDEEIFECVNGYYEGGFALLVATNIRLVLVDKKPFNFLNVEDLRFDMINEIDYSHRMMGAQIIISTGSKTLRFRSYNQQRLRKLIGHVQHSMAETKKRQSDHQEGQNQHLEQINQQLQTYLLAQYQNQLDFNQQLRDAQARGNAAPPPRPPLVKPDPELADYLYAQSLLRQHAEQQQTTQDAQAQPADGGGLPVIIPQPVRSTYPPAANAQADDLYDEGRREVFSKAPGGYTTAPPAPGSASAAQQQPTVPSDEQPAAMPDFQLRLPQLHSLALEVNPLRIAYSKLPMALRNRKFGRPSFHDHSHATTSRPPITPLQHSASRFFGKAPRPARP